MLARYVGGDAAVLSGLMRGADEIRQRPFAVDVPGGYTGKGRVVLFSNNPIYRWQNHGEFNMVFNAMMNWNDLRGAAGVARDVDVAAGRRAAITARNVSAHPVGAPIPGTVTSDSPRFRADRVGQ